MPTILLSRIETALMSANPLKDGLTISQLISIVREMTLSEYLNPIVDEVFVRVVISKDCFSKLIIKYPEAGTDDDGAPPIHEIELNMLGILLLSNLASVLLGDHRDPAVYIDSAFSKTFFSIVPPGNFRFVDLVSVLQRERPDSFKKISIFSERMKDRSFEESARSVQSKFYSTFRDHDPHTFPMEAVTRFLVGHEIGHYVRRKYPKLRKNIETEIKALFDCDIENDSELFCDAVGMFHSIRVQTRLKRNLRPTVVMLCFILTFFDLVAFSKSAKSGRKSLSGVRYLIFVELASRYGNKSMVTDIMELSDDMEGILYPAIPAIDEMLELLAAAALKETSLPAWYLSTKDFFHLMQVSEG